MECDWKNTGDYWSVVEVIDAHSLAPPTREESHDCFFLWAQPLFFLVLQQRGRDTYC